MNRHLLKQVVVACYILSSLCLAGCQANKGTARLATAPNRNLAPQRVDIRGSILTRHYDQGQVILEVERPGFSPDSRYTRAYVLVEPITQITGIDGQHLSLSELLQGQQVAILLRGGGNGNSVGVGVARKVWVEAPY